MMMNLRLILFFLLITPLCFGQNIRGYIYDEITQEALIGVNVFYKDKDGTKGTISNLDGFYEIDVPTGSFTLMFSYIGYETLSIPVVISRGQSQTISVNMHVESKLMDEVVVSVGRYEQKLSEITVSMELLKASDIAKQAPTDLTAALKTISGVDVNDRQPSIRGGSGWTYGVGSRALIMVDGMSVLTPVSGEINWNVVPMENVDQIEVLKGASSVLYGSSALNGLINVRTKRPALEPKTSVKSYLGIYGNPSNKDYTWWDKSFWKEGNHPVSPLLRGSLFSGIRNPIYDGFDLSHSRRIGNLDVMAGFNYFTDEGFRSGSYNNRLRVGGNLTYHNPNISGMNYGLNGNFLSNDYADFFLWRSAEEAYQPSPLANMGRQSNMFYLDPFFNYSNPDNNTTHRVKGRFYYQGNQIVSNTTDKSIMDIGNSMGFDFNSIPDIVNMVENWQTELLPSLLVHLPDALNGNYTGLANEITNLSNQYFPNATTADYMDLISWVMGRTPLPSNTADLVQWILNSGDKADNNSPIDHTTSYYLDYQFNKKYEHSQFTAGTTYEHVYVQSAVTGDHSSDNIAAFFQYDHKFFDRLNVSAGVRLEYYRVDDNLREAETDIFGASLPFKPVFRGGLNYELAEYSFIRASFGQGYRYPSVTEKFVLKDIGGVGAFPNANLKAERGYNAELGFKQGYQIGGLKGFMDIAGFYTHYNDMIEFRIGLFDNKTFEYMTGMEDLIGMVQSGNGLGIGAQFYNMGRAAIYGVDASITGMYEFNPQTKLTFNLGYVYTEPRDLDYKERKIEEDANPDILAMRAKSNDSKYLKFRQKHSIKGVVDLEWKRLTIGTNLAWKSKTLAADYFMVDEREKPYPNLMDYVRGLLFGDLHGYWMEKNKSFFTADLRMGVKATKYVRFQGMINNIFNKEYSTRPMDVSAPRTFVLQMNIDF